MRARAKNWPQDWQLRLIQLLAIPGLIVAFYLLLFHSGELNGACSVSGWDDCGQVSGPNAPYSAIGPVPVALIGLVGYSVLFLLTWLNGWHTRLNDVMPELLVALTALAFVFSLGLTALEIFVLQAICRYCIISAVLVTAMFALSVSYLRSQSWTE
jgi:uncharacterized membrane protein